MREVLKKFKKLQPAPVAIFGAGLSGQGVKNLLDRMEWEYQIFDEQGRAFEMADARNCSMVVTSPGFYPQHPWYKLAEKEGKEILGELEFGALFLDGQKVVAITGTNGKTSVTTLMHHVCQALGIKSVIAGNIGTPITELIAEGLHQETTIFLETSSFQARNLKYFKPTEVIWTNFAPDHLDYHGNLNEYFRAKYRLLEFNKFEKCMVGESVHHYGKKHGFIFPESVKIIGKFSKEQVSLPTNHFLSNAPQLENLALVQSWFTQRGLNQNDFYKIVENYHGQPHRLQVIKSKIKDITFWNDSKATNHSAVLAACKNFTDKFFWIGGGKSKGEDLEGFAGLLKPYIKKAFLFGETGPALHSALKNHGLWSVLCEDLKDAVTSAIRFATSPIDILFSPGFSSFDQYKNYQERGKHFEDIVLDLKKGREEDTSLIFKPFALPTGR